MLLPDARKAFDSRGRSFPGAVKVLRIVNNRDGKVLSDSLIAKRRRGKANSFKASVRVFGKAKGHIQRQIPHRRQLLGDGVFVNCPEIDARRIRDDVQRGLRGVLG